jgi:hypothetical protein
MPVADWSGAARDDARRPGGLLVSLNTFRVIIQTVITLATGSLGFVAALAWNEAISTTIRMALGEGGGLGALYFYAIVATVIAIVVVLILGRIAARVGGEAAITREVD